MLAGCVRLETVHLRGSAGLAREREVDGAGDGAGGQEAMPAEGQSHAVHTGAEELPGQSPLNAANLKEECWSFSRRMKRGNITGQQGND